MACGTAYLVGKGVERSDSRGLSMLSVAAGMGSSHACGILGLANAEGRLGFDKNLQEATRRFREMQKCDRARPPRDFVSRRPLGCASTRRNAKHVFAPCVEVSGALWRGSGVFGTRGVVCVDLIYRSLTCFEKDTGVVVRLAPKYEFLSKGDPMSSGEHSN